MSKSELRQETKPKKQADLENCDNIEDICDTLENIEEIKGDDGKIYDPMKIRGEIMNAYIERSKKGLKMPTAKLQKKAEQLVDQVIDNLNDPL